nr:hypothetical protein [Streptomyces hyaluromycini]
MLDLFPSWERFERADRFLRPLNCGFVSDAFVSATPSEVLSEILDARLTLEADVSDALQWRCERPPGPRSLELRTWLDRATLIPTSYRSCMAMTLRLSDDLDTKLTERARREGRSRQGLVVEAIT